MISPSLNPSHQGREGLKMLDRKGKEIILRMGRREVFHTDDEGNSQQRKLVSSPLVGED